jgi:hypothetical protein
MINSLSLCVVALCSAVEVETPGWAVIYNCTTRPVQVAVESPDISQTVSIQAWDRLNLRKSPDYFVTVGGMKYEVNALEVFDSPPPPGPTPAREFRRPFDRAIEPRPPFDGTIEPGQRKRSVLTQRVYCIAQATDGSIRLYGGYHDSLPSHIGNSYLRRIQQFGLRPFVEQENSYLGIAAKRTQLRIAEGILNEFLGLNADVISLQIIDTGVGWQVNLNGEAAQGSDATQLFLNTIVFEQIRQSNAWRIPEYRSRPVTPPLHMWGARDKILTRLTECQWRGQNW